MAKETTSDLDLIKQLEKEVGRKLPQKDYKTLMEGIEPGFALAAVEGEDPGKVRGINLSYLKLKAIPRILAIFRHMEGLVLVANEISDLSPLAGLTKLAELDFRYNQVRYLSPLAGLTNLAKLFLWKNNVRYLSPLAGLTNLAQLNFGGNQVSDIYPLVGLTKMTQLYLWENKVSDLSPLARLTNLALLRFDNNQVSDLSPLAGLTKLKQVDARKNQIKSLPPSILELETGLDVKDDKTPWHQLANNIYLAGNPLEQPPPEIIKQGKAAVRDYFRAMEKEKDRLTSLQEIKVLLLGDGGSGKTSLVKQLLGQVFDEKESQTHGINITPLEVDASFPGGATRPITAHLWDFGGQEIMHASHQFFLSKRSLYILVLDGRKDEKTEYWLKHSESFGGNSPILVVMNKVDENTGFDLDRLSLKKKYPNIKDFYRISCKTSEGISTFKQALAKHIPDVELLSIPVPGSWLRVKEKLQTATADHHYISDDQFNNICAGENINDESTRQTLVEFLNELGVVLHFHTLALRDFHVLDPHWVTEAVYRIINSPFLADKGGILEEEKLDFVLNKEKTNRQPLDIKRGKMKYSLPEQRYIISLMKRFELCYTVGDGERQILIPGLLTPSTPSFVLPGDNSLRFRLRYDFLPRSVMPRFIVKTHTSIKDGLRWRSGVVLGYNDPGTTALVTADEEEKTIDIEVVGERRRDHLAVIRDHFREINRSFEKINVDELISLPIPAGLSERYGSPDKVPPEYRRTVSYRFLLGYEKKGQREYLDGETGVTYDVSGLLDTVESAQRRSRERNLDIEGEYETGPGRKQGRAFRDTWTGPAEPKVDAVATYHQIKEIEIRIENLKKLRDRCDSMAEKKANRTAWRYILLNLAAIGGWVAAIVLIKQEILNKWVYLLPSAGFLFQAVCFVLFGRKITFERSREIRLAKLKQEQYELNRFNGKELELLQEEKKKLENSFGYS